MKKILICITLSLVSQIVSAETVMFQIKKSYNPKNYLNYAVDVDENCTIKKGNAGPIKAYWVMGEEDGHTEGLNSSEKPIYEPKVTFTSSDNKEVDFNVPAILKFKHLISDPTIKIASKKENGKCNTEANLTIDGQEINLKKVYIDGKFTIFMDWHTNYMTITGLKPDGSAFTKKYVP